MYEGLPQPAEPREQMEPLARPCDLEFEYDVSTVWGGVFWPVWQPSLAPRWQSLASLAEGVMKRAAAHPPTLCLFPALAFLTVDEHLTVDKVEQVSIHPLKGMPDPACSTLPAAR